MSIETDIARIAAALEQLVQNSATTAALLADVLAARPAASDAADQAIEAAATKSRGRKAKTADAEPAAAPATVEEPAAVAAPAATPATVEEPAVAAAPAAAGAVVPSLADCQAKAAALSAKIGSAQVVALITKSGVDKLSKMSDAQRVEFYAGLAALEAPTAAAAFE